ncbi:MAG: DUF192 domain-containing protein [Bdellovibrionales bacterium]|nr:DUF192 domain-containing protein [Bdellovibrionales bacterium]
MNRSVRLINLKDQRIISDKCIVAESFFSRLRGWIGKTRADSGEGILFPRCTSIHMWFMVMPIDVVFLRVVHAEGSERKVVTSAHARVRPWKALPLNDWDAHEALELPEGSIARLGIAPGDELCIG